MYSYPAKRTALLLIDPYNDFLHERGMLWPHMAPCATRVGLVPNMGKALRAARERGIFRVFVPHHRHDEGDYGDWMSLCPTHEQMSRAKPFARGTWGADFHPDVSPAAGEIVCTEHWMQSGFANTDLDYQLRNRGVDHVVLSGVRTNGCFESTGRYAVELGYHVTLLTDATAAFTQEDMDATLRVNARHFAHQMLTTEEFVQALGRAA